MSSLPKCQPSSIRLQRQRDPHLTAHRAGQPVRRRSSPAPAQSANPHRDQRTLGPHLPRLRAWALLRRRPAHAAPPSCRRPRNLHQLGHARCTARSLPCNPDSDVFSQSNAVSDSKPSNTRPVECMTFGCTPMCCVMICTSRNARSSGQLAYIELAPPATYIRSTACTALLTA